MCGLVGVFGNLFQNDTTFFKQALITDFFRGRHSTGIASVDTGGSEVFKRAVDPITFLQFKAVDQMISTNRRLLMGHNRHATLGGVNDVNAHPFTQGDVTLCHNGTLDNKHQLERKYLKSGMKPFETDSELICWLFDNYLHEDIIPELAGAFALTWWDASDDTFRMVRNDERPLSYALTNNRMWYASEGLMLEWLLDRNTLGYKSEVKELPVGELLEIKYNLATIDTCTKKIEVQEKVYSGYNCRGNRGFGPHYSHNSGGSQSNRNFRSQQRGSTSRSAFEQQFQRDHDVDYGVGSTIFGWLTDVTPSPSNSERSHMTFTLITDPYSTIKAYSVDYRAKAFEGYDKCKIPMMFKLRLRSFMKDTTPNGDGSLSLIADNRKDKVEALLDEAAENEGFAWADANQGKTQDVIPFNKDKKSQDVDSTGGESGKKSSASHVEAKHENKRSSKPQSNENTASESLLEDYEAYSLCRFTGFQGTQITPQTFRRACDRGCSFCGDPVDFDTEACDQSVMFINHDDVVCGSCQQTKEFQEQYLEFGPEIDREVLASALTQASYH